MSEHFGTTTESDGISCRSSSARQNPLPFFEFPDFDLALRVPFPKGLQRIPHGSYRPPPCPAERPLWPAVK